MSVNIFIQARMSSSRYPGKMLAPFKGQPLIQHIVGQCRKVTQADTIIVLTSCESSDDPLAFYLEKLGIDYYRGSLTNVANRFQEALQKFPCEYFVRICGDSPYIEANLIDQLISAAVSKQCDMVSNVTQRTFPQGQSVEILKSIPFKEICSDTLSAHEAEHVSPYIYNNIGNYTVLSVEYTKNESNINLCVDTIEDLKRLEEDGNIFNFDMKNLCYLEN